MEICIKIRQAVSKNQGALHIVELVELESFACLAAMEAMDESRLWWFSLSKRI